MWASPPSTSEILPRPSDCATSDGHFGKTYSLNGPELLNGLKLASIWSELLDKEIRYSGDDMRCVRGADEKAGPSWSASTSA